MLSNKARRLARKKRNRTRGEMKDLKRNEALKNKEDLAKTLAIRAEKMGVCLDGRSAIKDVTDPRRLTPLGLLDMAAKLSETGDVEESRQCYLAGSHLAQLHGRYLWSVEAPKPHAKAVNMGGAPLATPTSPSDEHLMRAKEAWEKTEEALKNKWVWPDEWEV